MIILRFKCLIYVYHDNKKLYHIMIMDPCDRYITLSILLHINNLWLCVSEDSPHENCLLILSVVIVHAFSSIIIDGSPPSILYQG